MYNDEMSRHEIYVSEVDREREPLAAQLADFMFDSDLPVTRVDPRGRAVTVDGDYAEGTWDPERERYTPNPEFRPQDPTPDSKHQLEGDESEEDESEEDKSTKESDVDATLKAGDPKRTTTRTVGNSIRTKPGGAK